MKRFPFGLTVAAFIAFAILVGLGAWQVQRLAWKEGVIARIAALRQAPARPLAAALADLSAGRDVAFTRVETRCEPPSKPSPVVYRYALRDRAVAWRLLTPCHLTGGLPGGVDGVILDRGVIKRFDGLMAPGAARFAEPVRVSGVLREVGARPLLGGAGEALAGGVRTIRAVDHAELSRLAAEVEIRQPAPYLLAVEQERPASAELLPAALPTDVPNNHLVYAMTWYALALILAWFYAALVWRRMRGR